jgi:hypothetical protein
MATKCPNCGSLETQTLLDRDQCLICGQHFDANGKLAAGMDQSTREDFLRRVAPRQTNVVGNLADLQRGGALVVTGQSDKIADGVEPPPGTSTAGLKAEAKANEKVDAAIAAAADELADAQAKAAEGVVSASASAKSDKADKK